MSGSDKLGAHPFLKTAVSAGLPAPPAQLDGVPRPAAGGGITALLSLTCIVLAPVALWYGAWLLIELLTALPVPFALFGTLLVIAGGAGWMVLREQDWVIEPDDDYVWSPLWSERK